MRCYAGGNNQTAARAGFAQPQDRPRMAEELNQDRRTLGAERTPSARRSQEERSSATRKVLLDAALRALATHGFANASISEVLRFACMSRGALLHHFPSKDELFAAAMVHLYEQRLTRFRNELTSLPLGDGTLRERLWIVREEYERWFPVTIEFMTAIRTDEALRSAFDRRIKATLNQMTTDYSDLCPEFSNTPAALWIPYVIGCFIRGLCLESIVNDERIVNGAFDQFVTLLEHYQEHLSAERTGAAERSRKPRQKP